MADALVSIAVEKLTDILGKQLALFSDASGELERLRKTFQSIQAVLADAESRQIDEKSLRPWLSSLRDVAYDIDSVLNEWLICGLEKDGSEHDSDDDDDDAARNRARATACLPSPKAIVDQTVSRYRIANSIKEIRERLDQIAKDKDQFNLSQISSFGNGKRPERSRTLTSSHKEEEMIGRDVDRAGVISSLVSGSSSDDGQVQVIAIVGIGGLGKTTLARKVYNDDEVRNHFQKFMWVCVSEDFDVKRLTKAIIEQVKKESSSLLELDSLQNELLDALRGKQFLLVLDDVWNDDREKWNTLRASLTSGAPGSRILVTTRLTKVAENTMNSSYVHEIKGLSDHNSWTLFSTIAFGGREADECLQLESVGKEIVSKCKGVPLSITVMGSVMNSKQIVEDWQNVLNSKMRSFREAENRILPALWLSYYNLPSHLKQCFVYCSIYEKDEEMIKDELVKLWIAQGLVQSEESREVEHIGTEYFDDLVAWSMFQEVRTNSEGKITCKMHDLLHDLAQFITRDETYILTSESSNRCPPNVRHASFTLSENSPIIPIASHGGKKLRTLFLHGYYDKIVTVPPNLFRHARSLMTLFLKEAKIKRLPESLGKLKHLTYLDLAGSWIVELPDAIGKMKRLIYLGLSGTKLRALPNAVGKLKDLRLLDLSGSNLVELPNEMGKMRQLRYLYLSESNLVQLPNEIGKMKQLRCLDLSGSKLVQLPNAIGKMKRLEYLILNETNIEELPESLSDLRNLHTLSLNFCSQLKRLPRGIVGVMSLRNLEIRGTNSLECLPTGMSRITSLRSLCKFIVGGEGGCGIDELQQLNSLQGEIEITHLERSSSGEEARKAELCKKPHLSKLFLKMFERDEDIVMSRRDPEIDRMDSVLEGLRPHVDLEELHLYCNKRSSKLPSWMEDASFLKLTRLTIDGFIHCEQNLPGIGKLPKLKYLDIRDVGVKKMGHKLYYGNSCNDAVDRTVVTFPMLEELCLSNMSELEEWELTSEANADVMPSLRRLELSKCPKLEGLPHHLAKAPLKRLQISDCPMIKGTGCSYFPLLEKFTLTNSNEFLSAGFPDLPNLKNFGISELRNERLPDGGWERLVTLETLEITNCNELKSVPDGLGQLKKLKRLCIDCAETLGCIPDSLGQLESLEQLDIRGLKILQSLPEGLGQLQKLKSLEISGAEALICLPDSLGQLESLENVRMYGLKNLQSLPDGLGQLRKLRSLEIFGAEALICLPDSLGQLESLEDVQMYGLKNLQSLPEGLGQLRKLRELAISGAEALTHLPDSLAWLDSLEYLGIDGWKKLESLPHWLGQLKKLSELRITQMEGLICLPGSLGQLVSLKSLDIGYCKKLKSLPRRLGQLKSLTIGYLEALTCPPDMRAQLKSLEYLTISGWKELESLPHWLGRLKSLKCLYIYGCTALRSLPNGLGDLPFLMELRIRGCPLMLERCKKEGGEEWPKIARIPIVVINDQRI